MAAGPSRPMSPAHAHVALFNFWESLARRAFCDSRHHVKPHTTSSEPVCVSVRSVVAQDSSARASIVKSDRCRPVGECGAGSLVLLLGVGHLACEIACPLLAARTCARREHRPWAKIKAIKHSSNQRHDVRSHCAHAASDSVWFRAGYTETRCIGTVMSSASYPRVEPICSPVLEAIHYPRTGSLSSHTMLV